MSFSTLVMITYWIALGVTLGRLCTLRFGGQVRAKLGEAGIKVGTFAEELEVIDCAAPHHSTWSLPTFSGLAFLLHRSHRGLGASPLLNSVKAALYFPSSSYF
jgi:hypothetical protein